MSNASSADPAALRSNGAGAPHGGLAKLQNLGKLLTGEIVVDARGCGLKNKRLARACITDGIAACEVARHCVWRRPLQYMLNGGKADTGS